jgi:hypothetical protein
MEKCDDMGSQLTNSFLDQIRKYFRMYWVTLLSAVRERFKGDTKIILHWYWAETRNTRPIPYYVTI